MDSKQAEKEYLRRSAGGAWELSKPFPARGQTATDGHAQHLVDFAVLLRVLAPARSDLILDLGAGSCWVSDWLRRFGFKTVATDIALDMLRVGRTRLNSSEGLVAADMEHLPFATASFTKACCVDAFHHVPDMAAALREIRRVLTPDGVAFFSEPGVGHASNPVAIAATRNYGVQEKEIIIADFMDACRRAGFADVRLHPLSNIVPLFDLTPDQWAQWSTFTASKRPVRALQKLWRAVLELFGLRKHDLLFEEAFAIRLLRELQPIIESHPTITAHCAPFTRPEAKPLDAAKIELLEAPESGGRETSLRMRFRVTNSGTTSWNTRDDQEVRLGVQLLSVDGTVVDRNYERHELPRLSPHEQSEVIVEVRRPANAGTVALRFDVVREGVHWFEQNGSETCTHTVAGE
jgi:ubiquinone/menaquinone biosynthesis C-methylase UbiE